jgi:hypothetical protein
MDTSVSATSRGNADGVAERLFQGCFERALERRSTARAGRALDCPAGVRRAAIAERQPQSA